MDARAYIESRELAEVRAGQDRRPEAVLRAQWFTELFWLLARETNAAVGDGSMVPLSDADRGRLGELKTLVGSLEWSEEPAGDV